MFLLVGQFFKESLLFHRFIPEEKALVYRSNSDFPIRETPTKLPDFVLHNGKQFFYVEQSEYNIQMESEKGKKKFLAFERGKQH